MPWCCRFMTYWPWFDFSFGIFFLFCVFTLLLSFSWLLIIFFFNLDRSNSTPPYEIRVSTQKDFQHVRWLCTSPYQPDKDTFTAPTIIHPSAWVCRWPASSSNTDTKYTSTSTSAYESTTPNVSVSLTISIDITDIGIDVTRNVEIRRSRARFTPRLWWLSTSVAHGSPSFRYLRISRRSIFLPSRRRIVAYSFSYGY